MSVETSGNLVPILAVVILILLIVIAWLLRQRDGALPGNGDDDPSEPPKERLVNRHYASDQVIVGGSSANIVTAVEKISDPSGLNIALTEIFYETAATASEEKHADKEKTSEPPPIEKQQIDANVEQAANEQNVSYNFRRAFCSLAAETGNDFQFRHYRVKTNPRGFSAPEIEEKINELELEVCASANYAVGRAIDMLEGDPGSGEGFPGSGEGFPGSGEGFPFTPIEEHAVKANFYNQWALHNAPVTPGRGIDLFKEQFSEADCLLEGAAFRNIETQKRTVEVTGNKCRIVIFDSSPYDDFLQKQNDVASPFIKKVVHNEIKGTPDARDHGLFVASLAHVVAPDSEIYLYRVLNDSNRGYLETLLYNICEAIREFKQDTRQEKLCGLVLNISMGIHVEENLRQQVVQGTKDEGALVPALYCLLKKAHEEGAIIVAAVGNDSAQQISPKPAQVPALYSFVIGVEAGNFYGERSCFSNKGKVRAPGGDNKVDPTDAGCTVQPYESLSKDERKITSVIGFVKEISPTTKYAFWRGTSFAAPMVSGLAALLLEVELSKESCDTDKVRQIILGTETTENIATDTDTPIINVPMAINAITNDRK